MYCIQHCFICCPSDSTVSEDARIEPRTVATSASTARRSDYHTRLDLDLFHYSARSHRHFARFHPQTRLDLIYTRLDLIHTRLDLIHKLGYISSTNSEGSHPLLG
jgi:hypothetical protein